MLDIIIARPGQPGLQAGHPDMWTFSGKIVPLLKVMRLHNALGCALVFLAGRTGLHSGNWSVELGAALAVGLLCVAAHLTNDLVDLPADRTNRPDRPLANGRLNLAVVRLCLLLSWLWGIGLGIILMPALWPWWVFWAIAGPGYSLWVKGRGWLAPVWTAAVITSCCIPGLWERGMSAIDMAVLLFMFWYLLFREIVKILADFRGDCLAGYRPFGAGTAGLYLKTFILGLPLALVAGWFMMRSSIPVQRDLGLCFLACLIGALLLVWNRLQPLPHLAGSLLKVGAFSGLALLFIVSP